MLCAFVTKKKRSAVLLSAGVRVTYYPASGRLTFGNAAFEPVDVVDLDRPELILGDLRIHQLASVEEVSTLLSALTGCEIQLEIQNMAYFMFVMQAPIEDRLPRPAKQPVAAGKVLPLRKARTKRSATASR